MSRRMKRKREPIHHSVKQALGYDPLQDDSSVLEDWKQRKTRVCKPCWELKYCPYGPLVEQSPTIPSLRNEMAEHMEYFKECLRTGLVGSRQPLSAEQRDEYRRWMEDEQILLRQALTRLQQRREIEAASGLSTPAEQIEAATLNANTAVINLRRTRSLIPSMSSSRRPITISKRRSLRIAQNATRTTLLWNIRTNTCASFACPLRVILRHAGSVTIIARAT